MSSTRAFQAWKSRMNSRRPLLFRRQRTRYGIFTIHVHAGTDWDSSWGQFHIEYPERLMQVMAMHASRRVCVLSSAILFAFPIRNLFDSIKPKCFWSSSCLLSSDWRSNEGTRYPSVPCEPRLSKTGANQPHHGVESSD